MNNSRKLFIFSAHYPFGNGETFLEDELKTAEQFFTEIVIISADKQKHDTGRYVPENAAVVNCRKKRIELIPLIKAFFKMLLPRTWKEKRFAYRTLGYAKQKRRVNKAILIDYYFSALLERAVRQMDIPEDAVLYAYWMSSSAYFLSNYKKKHPKTTCICRTHGGDCYIDRFYQPFRREILHNLDAVFPISEAGKRSIETLLMPHAVGMHAPLTVERLGVTKLSERMNPPESTEEFRIVTCSNVIPLKRLDLMIDALSLIENRNIYWVHFGDGELMEEMRSKAENTLLSSSIRYEFKGRVAKSEILQWYEDHHVDLFVNCSDTEGIPVSVMEAFSYGIPAIARNVGGVGELVVSGHNGWLLPTVCTPDQLKEAILVMIDGSDNSQLRTGAYETYINCYNAEKNYTVFYEHVEQLKRT